MSALRSCRTHRGRQLSLAPARRPIPRAIPPQWRRQRRHRRPPPPGPPAQTTPDRLLSRPCSTPPEARSKGRDALVPTTPQRRGAQERSRDETACGARSGARPLTGPSTVAASAKVEPRPHQSEEISVAAFEEIHPAVDIGI